MKTGRNVRLAVAGYQEIGIDYLKLSLVQHIIILFEFMPFIQDVSFIQNKTKVINILFQFAISHSFKIYYSSKIQNKTTNITFKYFISIHNKTPFKWNSSEIKIKQTIYFWTFHFSFKSFIQFIPFIRNENKTTNVSFKYFI